MTSVDRVLSGLLSQPDEKKVETFEKLEAAAKKQKQKLKLERRKERELRREKKLLADLEHVIPDFSTGDYEKKLLKIATRGVVTLFNAVAKHQKSLDNKADDEEGPASKKAKTKAVKSDFLQIVGSNQSVASEAAVPAGKPQGFLRDNFDTKFKNFRDWDRDSEDDDDDGEDDGGAEDEGAPPTAFDVED
eukprot:TRINITY_DN8414_c0_g1_i3.p1 TRINITY_DN8414_c0_g1~~TRINITY_DN8414_c0_g1_i3.p1  ORF type:complete len:209 (-),score=60.85 TRINITY_DN8414_c0_g1_i3:24-593(-)